MFTASFGRLVHGRTRGTGVLGIARMLAAVAVAAGVLCMVPDAQAQGRRMNFGMRAGPGGGRETAISTREVSKWMEILGLGADQKGAVEALHEAYQEEYRVERKALQDLRTNAQQEFMESPDPSAFKEVAEKSAAHNAKMASLDTQFMSDIKAVLDPRQAERWPRVERFHRRSESLPNGMLAGESVNLESITEDMGIKDESAELRDAIEQYEVDLDKALTERDQKRGELRKQGEESMKDFDLSKIDFSKIREMMQETRKTGIRVRDVNERYARLIAAAVPADRKADFEQRVRKATYPMVYREPYAAKAVDAALAFDDLTAEQKESLASVKTAYQRDLATANEQWAAAVNQEEKDGGGDPFMGFGRMVPGGGGDDKPSPVEEARKARRELDRATLDKIKTILTESQQDRLPEREVENPWMGNFGGRAADDADESPAKVRPERKK